MVVGKLPVITQLVTFVGYLLIECIESTNSERPLEWTFSPDTQDRLSTMHCAWICIRAAYIAIFKIDDDDFARFQIGNMTPTHSIAECFEIDDCPNSAPQLDEKFEEYKKVYSALIYWFVALPWSILIKNEEERLHIISWNAFRFHILTHRLFTSHWHSQFL